MSEVKRVEIDHKGLPFFDDRGVYVFYEDYAALQQKLDAMGHECGKMLGLLNDICRYHEECTHDDMMHALIPLEYVSAINTFVERDVDGENPFAATDAFLNEVRAEGAIACGVHLREWYDYQVESRAEDFAAKLRAGSAEGGV